MTDAPERIWIEPNGGNPYFYEEGEMHDAESPVTGYIRADLVAAMKAENRRLRLALRIIAGYEQCLDNLMSNADIAREALRNTEINNQ